ncbi:MAG: hypothetical protein IJ379_01790 [Lachnospiraceae bacterium]|nr:hypothetical protein [Lachnospiraceae bacterium]
MKKWKISLLVLLCCSFLVSCNIDAQKQEMPDIVFSYEVIFDDEDIYEIWFIDKSGNIYFSDESELVFCGFQERNDKYVAGEWERKISHVGTVEVSELKKYHEILKKLADNDEFELVFDGFGLNVEMPWKLWYGMYYDTNGELKHLLFCQKDSGTYTPNDSKASDIANWMNSLMESTKPKE